MSDWTKVVALHDIPKLGSRLVRSAKGEIAIFRTEDDRVFALHNNCPHKGGPLSQGIVYGDKVACPLHNWRISLVDGQAEEPDEGHTACFAVKVEDGAVYLEI
ncbi:MAG: nitrite reductase (NAD(P)H) small subunit [Betaproteobacteria bacterium HGW-Betaproteobacteria-1]|jgi:nitrite reductase (NADH) small subunit|nr:MAG: nitrite reductase (NAD(P)H) small subunit [Betaproteobacteria bacterium HGW-Betaproteobacteria-1]